MDIGASMFKYTFDAQTLHCVFDMCPLRYLYVESACAIYTCTFAAQWEQEYKKSENIDKKKQIVKNCYSSH